MLASHFGEMDHSKTIQLNNPGTVTCKRFELHMEMSHIRMDKATKSAYFV